MSTNSSIYDYIPSRRLADKIAEYEEQEQISFADMYALSAAYFNRDITKGCNYYVYLFHGIKNQPITRIESIFQDKAILCGKKIKTSITSYDGTIKNLEKCWDSDENCNMGEYISVTSFADYEDLLKSPYNSYASFIQKNIFFIIKGTVPAIETCYLSFEDYNTLIQSGYKYSKFYSYASEEYFVKDSISLDDIVAIGIDSNHFLIELKETISQIKRLMEEYKIDIPFIDIATGEVLYQLEKEISAHSLRMLKS